MSDPLYTIAVEFVAGSFTNVTSDCLHFSYNRELATYDRGLTVGGCELIMQNEERKYSPANSGSPFFPHLKPNKRLQIQATYLGSTYNLFSGYINGFSINPIIGNRTAYIQASDRIKIMNMQDIDLAFKTNYNVSSLVTDILSSLAVNSADRVVDAIADNVTFAWFTGRKGTDSLNELLTLGNYQAYVGGDGKVNVRNRYYQFEGSVVASLTEFHDFSYSLNDELIGNVLRINGTPRRLATSVGTIAWLQTIETIPASSHASFWLTYVDPDTQDSPTPANSVIFPVALTDFMFNTQSDGAGTDLTTTTSVNGILFGATAVFSLFNGSGNAAYITKFKVRGYPIQRQPVISYQEEISSSQAAYGKRVYTIDSNLINDIEYAKNYMVFLIDKKKDPEEVPVISLKNEWGPLLGLELGSLIFVSEAQTSVNSVFSVINMNHEIELTRGLEHTVTYNLEMWKNKSEFILDHASYGLLDSRRLTL